MLVSCLIDMADNMTEHAFLVIDSDNLYSYLRREITDL